MKEPVGLPWCMICFDSIQLVRIVLRREQLGLVHISSILTSLKNQKMDGKLSFFIRLMDLKFLSEKELGQYFSLILTTSMEFSSQGSSMFVLIMIHSGDPTNEIFSSKQIQEIMQENIPD